MAKFIKEVEAEKFWLDGELLAIVDSGKRAEQSVEWLGYPVKQYGEDYIVNAIVDGQSVTVNYGDYAIMKDGQIQAIVPAAKFEAEHSPVEQ